MSSIACVSVCDQDIELFFCAEQYLDPKEVNNHFSSTSTRRVAGQLAEAVPQGSHPISDPEHCTEEASELRRRKRQKAIRKARRQQRKTEWRMRE